MRALNQDACLRAHAVQRFVGRVARRHRRVACATHAERLGTRVEIARLRGAADTLAQNQILLGAVENQR